MFDLIKKAVFTGIGVTHMTKDKVKRLGDDIAREAKLSEEEGKKFVEELQKKSENARIAGEKMIKDTVEKTLKALNIPSKEDIKALERRIAQLESKQ